MSARLSRRFMIVLWISSASVFGVFLNVWLAPFSDGAYQIQSRFQGIDRLFTMSLSVFISGYLAALIPWWISRKEKDYDPALLAVLSVLGLGGAFFLSALLTYGILRFVVFFAGFFLVYLAYNENNQKSLKVKDRYVSPVIGLIVVFGLFVLLGGVHPNSKFPHDETIEKRHLWATRHLNPFYQIAVGKIRSIDRIKQDVGEHLSIAPLPHSKNTFFDGWSTFNLEVQGEKGAGHCSIVYRDYHDRPPDFQKIEWIFNGQRAFLEASKIVRVFKSVQRSDLGTSYPAYRHADIDKPEVSRTTSGGEG